MRLKQKNIWIKLITCIFPIIILSLIFIFRNYIISLGTLLPACPSYTYLHIYCPGCGNTRSVQHLLAGDVLGSIKYNPSVVFGILIVILAYLEYLTFVFGNHIKLIPRSRKLWTIILFAFLLFFIIRNFISLF
jgi:hypothetical protein